MKKEYKETKTAIKMKLYSLSEYFGEIKIYSFVMLIFNYVIQLS